MPLQDKPKEAHRSIPKPDRKDTEEQKNAIEDPTCDEYHNMKEKEEDDDAKPKSINESTQLIDWPAHVEWKQQPNYAGYQLMQVKEAAYSMELIILQIYYMFRPFSERSLFHIGGFWDFYVQIPITKMIFVKNKNYWLETCLLG